MYFDPSYTAEVVFTPVYEVLQYPTPSNEAELHWEQQAGQEVRTQIASLQPSYFKQTALEEEQRYYATFPQAREAAIDDWTMSDSLGTSWSQPQCSTSEDAAADAAYSYSSVPYTGIHAPTPTSTFSTYTLAQALDLPSIRRVDALQTLHYDYSDNLVLHGLNTPSINDDRASQGRNTGQYNNSSIPCNKTSLPCRGPVIDPLRIMAPARKPARITRTAHIRSPPYTPPASKKQIACSATPSDVCHDLKIVPSSFPLRRRRSSPVEPMSPTFEQPQYTGDWETDAIAAAEYNPKSGNARSRTPVMALPTLPSPKQTDEDVSPTHRHSSCQSRSSRQRPYSLAKPRSPKASTASSHQPRKRAPLARDKDGKPVMACLFCRGRKIACGPPPSGSTDATCNQCARRGLVCHYPTESRRGMRRKRDDVADDKCTASSSSSRRRKVVDCDLVMDDPYALSDDSEDSSSEWDGDL